MLGNCNEPSGLFLLCLSPGCSEVSKPGGSTQTSICMGCTSVTSFIALAPNEPTLQACQAGWIHAKHCVQGRIWEPRRLDKVGLLAHAAQRLVDMQGRAITDKSECLTTMYSWSGAGVCRHREAIARNVSNGRSHPALARTCYA